MTVGIETSGNNGEFLMHRTLGISGFFKLSLFVQCWDLSDCFVNRFCPVLDVGRRRGSLEMVRELIQDRRYGIDGQKMHGVDNQIIHETDETGCKQIIFKFFSLNTRNPTIVQVHQEC